MFSSAGAAEGAPVATEKRRYSPSLATIPESSPRPRPLSRGSWSPWRPKNALSAAVGTWFQVQQRFRGRACTPTPASRAPHVVSDAHPSWDQVHAYRGFGCKGPRGIRCRPPRGIGCHPIVVSNAEPFVVSDAPPQSPPPVVTGAFGAVVTDAAASWHQVRRGVVSGAGLCDNPLNLRVESPLRRGLTF